MAEKGKNESENEASKTDKDASSAKKIEQSKWYGIPNQELTRISSWANPNWTDDKGIFISSPNSVLNATNITNWATLTSHEIPSGWQIIETEPSPSVDKSTLEIEDNIKQLKKERQALLDQLVDSTKLADTYKRNKSKLAKIIRDREQVISDLIKVNASLQQQIASGNLFMQVNAEARKKLAEDAAFKELFETIQNPHSYVVSIDIRRSTELMLKAKSPILFQEFIVGLCRGLSDIILKNFGIFDKFTGDGILAFYPSFFSGDDAGLMAVKSSLECQEFFNEFYKNNRRCFASILKDVGLGIGIDCGDICLVNMYGSYTVVGNPVVYACRFSGAKAGDTLLNETAYEEISNNYKNLFNFEETSIDVKHEGEFVAYKVISNGEKMQFKKPDWDQLIKKYSK